MINQRLNSLLYLFPVLFILSSAPIPSFAETEVNEPAATVAEEPIAQEPEQAKAEEPAAAAAEEEAPAKPPINAPKIAIRMLGPEFNIQVLYDYPMDHANGNYIESIQMESPKGDFLGLSTFGPNATEAYAEFMVNPKLADFTEVVLIASSSKGGQVRTPVKLELTEQPQLERAVPANKTRPVKKADAPKGNGTKSEDSKGKKFLFF